MPVRLRPDLQEMENEPGGPTHCFLNRGWGWHTPHAPQAQVSEEVDRQASQGPLCALAFSPRGALSPPCTHSPTGTHDPTAPSLPDQESESTDSPWERCPEVGTAPAPHPQAAKWRSKPPEGARP